MRAWLVAFSLAFLASAAGADWQADRAQSEGFCSFRSIGCDVLWHEVDQTETTAAVEVSMCAEWAMHYFDNGGSATVMPQIGDPSTGEWDDNGNDALDGTTRHTMIDSGSVKWVRANITFTSGSGMAIMLVCRG